jgi:hypothetical protein
MGEGITAGRDPGRQTPAGLEVLHLQLEPLVHIVLRNGRLHLLYYLHLHILRRRRVGWEGWASNERLLPPHL